MSESFNACEYLLDRRLAAGDENRLALTGPGGELTYAQLHEQVCGRPRALRCIGLQPEQRMLMCMADSPEFVIVYLAAMRIGAIPVPVSTMTEAPPGSASCCATRGPGCSRSPASSPGWPARRSSARRTCAGCSAGRRRRGTGRAAVARAGHAALLDPAGRRPSIRLPRTRPRSGCTRRAPRARRRPRCTGTAPSGWCARPTARRCSASRRRTGACRRRRPSSPTAWATRCCSRCRRARRPCSSRHRRGRRSWPTGRREYGATLFFAGPTFFADMLRAGLPPDALAGVRLAASAGEALPAALYTRWTTHFGVDILDGLGMTEMLHIFLSNQAGQVRPGTTGVAVPGYDLEIVDDDGLEVPVGTPGTLLVRGDIGRHRVLVALRRLAPGVPGGVATHRRYLRPGRRRLLHVPRPHRRHAQGERNVGGTGRSGGPAACPRGRRRRWSWSPPSTPTGWRSPWRS